MIWAPLDQRQRPSDRVAKALTALGRLVKTRNILRYLHDEPLRLRIQTQLNRGEARHGLARWLFFADQGEFRTSDFEMIMNKASCLSLLSNAVVLWNTLQIERIVTELRAAGTTIRARPGATYLRREGSTWRAIRSVQNRSVAVGTPA